MKLMPSEPHPFPVASVCQEEIFFLYFILFTVLLTLETFIFGIVFLFIYNHEAQDK